MTTNFVQKGLTLGQFIITDPEFSQGASGNVCMARSADNQIGIIKFIDTTSNDTIVHQFKSEYQLLSNLSHPNLATPLDFGFYDNHLYLITEYIDGQNLFDALYHLTLDEILPIMIQILEGLDYIHRNGFVHLDIKPENIIIQRSNSNAKIIDLGIASSTCGFKNKKQGTFPFLAPEIALGSEQIDGKADLFSFAAMMHYCLTRGDLPFLMRNRASKKGTVFFDKLIDEINSETLPDPVSHFRQHIPTYIDTMIHHLLAKKPSDRFYGNARAVINTVVTKNAEIFGQKQSNASYLRPKYNTHIGREEAQNVIQSAISDFAAPNSIQNTFIITIYGNTGIGKTHLLQKSHDWALSYIDKIEISNISFPAKHHIIDRWINKLNQDIAANQNPVLIIVDNLDCADPETKEFLKNISNHIIDRLNSNTLYKHIQPMGLIFTESQKITLDLESSHIKDIHLAPFSKEEVSTYISEIPAFSNISKNMHNQWVNALYEKTQGIPLDLSEYLQNLNNQGFLFTPSGDINIAGPDAISFAIPSSINERLLHSYKQLPPYEKEVINYMAVWNAKDILNDITKNELQYILKQIHLSQTIDNLIDKNIICESNEKETIIYHFTNSLFSTVIYNQLENSHLQSLHHDIAQLLMSHSTYPPYMAKFHKAYASDISEGINHFLYLGHYFLRKGKLSLSRDFLYKAFDHLTHSDTKRFIFTLALLIENNYLSGKYNDAYDLFLTYCKNQTDDRFQKNPIYKELLLKIIPALTEKMAFEESMSIIDDTYEYTQDNNHNYYSLTFINYHAQLAYKRAISWQGKPDYNALDDLQLSKKLYLESAQLEKTLPASIVKRITTNALGTVLLALGDFSGAYKWTKKRLERIQHATSIFDQILVHLTLADICRFQKKYSDAIIYAKKASMLVNTTGSNKWLFYVHQILATIYHDMDEFNLSLTHANQCLAASTALQKNDKMDKMLANHFIQMGHCYKELKNYDNALLFFLDALNKKCINAIRYISAYTGISEIYVHKHDFELATSYLNKADTYLNSIHSTLTNSFEFRIAKLRIEIMIATNEKKLIPEQLAKLKQFAKESPLFQKEVDELCSKNDLN